MLVPEAESESGETAAEKVAERAGDVSGLLPASSTPRAVSGAVLTSAVVQKDLKPCP